MNIFTFFFKKNNPIVYYPIDNATQLLLTHQPSHTKSYLYNNRIELILNPKDYLSSENKNYYFLNLICPVCGKLSGSSKNFNCTKNYVYSVNYYKNNIRNKFLIPHSDCLSSYDNSIRTRINIYKKILRKLDFKKVIGFIITISGFLGYAFFKDLIELIK